VDAVARWSAPERAELFTEAAARLGFGNPLIVEKDFWVCWVLHRVSLLEGQPRIIFKGGTSLSKVFGLIRRFSEDIDLAFHRHDLGYAGERDPGSAGLSRHRREALLESLSDASATLIAGSFLPALQSAVAAVIGDGGRLFVDGLDPESIIFEYPHCLPARAYAAGTYVRPQVRLELGARSDHEPQVVGELKPYAADVFGESFEAPACRVATLAAERTFWEKATLLHERALRPEAKQRERISRHYYDVVVISHSVLGLSALGRLDLLQTVARHKDVFFHAARDVYASAKPGTLRLVPPDGLLPMLRADYASVREMFFDDPPTFDTLLAELAALEARING
jgi:hypothetical protein